MTEPTNDLEALAAREAVRTALYEGLSWFGGFPEPQGDVPERYHRWGDLGEFADRIITALRSIAAPKQDVPLGVALRHMVHAYRLRMDCRDVRDELDNVLCALDTELSEEDVFYPPAKPDAPAEPTGDAGELVEHLMGCIDQWIGDTSTSRNMARDILPIIREHLTK